MLELTQKIDSTALPETNVGIIGTLMLPFEVRQKSRFRAHLTDGVEVGVVIERGSVLRGGDYLCPSSISISDLSSNNRLSTEQGLVQVLAAAEAVSVVAHEDANKLARAAYHLGNRHVPLQVGDGWVSYLQDHVLDDMCRQLGMQVTHEQNPFEPEIGAYGGQHGHHHE